MTDRQHRARNVFPKMLSGRQRNLFAHFFRGDFSRVEEEFARLPQELRDSKASHLAFASLAIMGKSHERVSPLLPEAIQRHEFWTILNNQISEEMQANSTGLLSQPKKIHKSLLAAGLGLRAGKRYFVETGTYIGSSIFQIHRLFESLWTVEAQPLLHRAALKLFEVKKVSNVHLSLGNSVEFLKSFSAETGNNAVFFLDAHYSTGITSRAYGRCPVIEEICVIMDNSPGALIVVDDVRTMNGKWGYPTLEMILRELPSWAQACVCLDQLIITRGSHLSLDISHSETSRPDI